MVDGVTRRTFLRGGAGLIAAAGSMAGSATGGHSTEACVLENRFVRYAIGADGRNLQFLDKQGGADHCARDTSTSFARVIALGTTFEASAVSMAGDRLEVAFGQSGVQVGLAIKTHQDHFTLEVLACEGPPVDELVIVDLPLLLKGAPEEPLAACALALNLQTNVLDLPGPSSRLRAMCYGRFGLVGAKVALIVCPPSQLRRVLQQAVAAEPRLPQSPIGGPWALGQAINQGSYLFNFGGLSLETVGDWIQLAHTLGMNQIDFHGGQSFRFGDCRPNPETYPQGLASLAAVVDRLHAAGIAAGLHTYAFFIDKSCPWVTPVPDARLASDATFTLAQAISADQDRIPVVEPTDGMSIVTGFFERNSVTLRIGEELITYGDIAKERPYAFTGCRRGACGTRPAAHAPGTQLHHLKECFGLFVPDPESTLLGEVADRTAEAYNQCGFDMIYLDALDGSDILGGADASWYYGSRYVFELWKRLKKPAVMEMSTFHHHLWYVRSRYGAWDHPNRSHKRFIDLHCAANSQSRRMFLPGQLGWWALKNWSGPQGEPTMAEDIEYLMGKCLGTDTGFALMGINPENVSAIPSLPRLAEIIKRYEDLRHSQKVSGAFKRKLRVPGDEYKLVGSLREGWHWLPTDYAQHRVEAMEEWSNCWTVANRFDAQPLKLRIEALMAAGPYEEQDNVVLVDDPTSHELTAGPVADGVTVSLEPVSERIPTGEFSVCYRASNTLASRQGTWTCMEKVFSPPIDLSAHQALGLWVYGDRKGEVLNVQLQSPPHITRAISDHYIPVDFTGWRYFELIEPEGERFAQYVWPYGNPYSIYRESVSFSQIHKVSFWYNRLPERGSVQCLLGPLKAMPLATGRLVDPAVTLGEHTIRFCTQLESGYYLEFNGPNDCKLYGPMGECLQEVASEGGIPVLGPGDNPVRLHCGGPAGIRARARVTIACHGQPDGNGPDP